MAVRRDVEIKVKVSGDEAFKKLDGAAKVLDKSLDGLMKTFKNMGKGIETVTKNTINKSINDTITAMRELGLAGPKALGKTREAVDTLSKHLVELGKKGSESSEPIDFFIRKSTILGQTLDNVLGGSMENVIDRAASLDESLESLFGENIENARHGADALSSVLSDKLGAAMEKIGRGGEGKAAGILNRLFERPTGDIGDISKVFTGGEKVAMFLNDILGPALDKTTDKAGTAMRALDKMFERPIDDMADFKEAEEKIDDSTSKAMTSVGKFGRRIGFLGFIMSYTAQRIIKSWMGVIGIFTKLAKEMSSTERATEFLEDTIEALALAGLLTEERMNEVLTVFDDTFTNSTALRGELGLLGLRFQQVKNAAVGPFILSLGEINTALDELNWTELSEDIEDISEAFWSILTPAITNFIALFGSEDDEGTAIGITEKFKKGLILIAEVAASFGEGIIAAIEDIILWFGNLIGEDGEGGEGVKGVAYWLGYLAVMAIPVGQAMTIFGSSINGVALAIDSVIKAASSLIVKLGGTATAGTVAFVLFIIGGLIASLILDWEEISEVWEETVGRAVEYLIDVIGGEKGLQGVMEGLDKFMTGMRQPFKAFWIGLGIWIGIIIAGIAVLIDAVKGLIKWFENLFNAWNKVKQKKVDMDLDLSTIDEEGLVGTGIGIGTGVFGEAGETGVFTPGAFTNMTTGIWAEDYDPSTPIIPGGQTGGIIKKSGIFRLHRGEIVVPRNQMNNMNMGGVTIIIQGSNDPRRTAEEVARRIRSLLVIP